MNSLKKTILSHPTGNEFVRAALIGLEKANLLSAFYTSIAAQDGTFFDIVSKFPGMAEFKKRKYHPSISPYVHARPMKELGRQLALKGGMMSLVQQETGRFSVDAVFKDLDLKVAKVIAASKPGEYNAIYAYEDGALESFKAAKLKGIKTIYDLPIGYWQYSRTLLKEEIENNPAWASTLTGFKDSAKKTDMKDEELKLADHVIVASTFTANSLAEYPSKINHLSIVPYGFPPVTNLKVYAEDASKPLKLLFVGGLSQRKGIANIFEAVASFGKHVELTVVGRKPYEELPVLNEALSKCNYIESLPHSEILKQMRMHDVLLFPSLFEGFGLVITEAMSQGTPVITTDRTAGPDLIEDGKNGWLIEASSTESLKEKIEQLLQNRELIAEVGKAALISASQRPWDVYGKEISDVIKNA